MKEKITLPDYPQSTDMWEHLKNTNKPILMYGMGNGADKILAELDKRGVEVADFFASDGFVRGHHFHGKRVLSYSEAKEMYGSFVVLLAFGSSLDEVISNVKRIASEQELYAPDVPVCGKEIFDSAFYNDNYADIRRAYESLADDVSREIFASIVRFKLSGDITYLTDTVCDEGQGLYDHSRYKVCVDAGAYRGETAAELIELNPDIERIYALEPDLRSYKKLCTYAEGERRVIPVNCGAWSESCDGRFSSQGNRNSSFTDSGEVLTRLDKIDNIIGEDIPDYIKYDVEGCESEALDGSRKTISEHYPDLLVCVYHRSRDIFAIVNKIKEEYPSYNIYTRRKKYIPAWDVYVCATKK